MSKIVFGNHSAVVLPRAKQGRIREFTVMSSAARSSGRLMKRTTSAWGATSHGVLYENEGIALDQGGFAKATYLELKADNVEEMRQKIVASGARVRATQDPHPHFQAPGGKNFWLVGTDEDLSRYEGTDHLELPGALCSMSPRAR